jgi:hypothetical protein
MATSKNAPSNGATKETAATTAENSTTEQKEQLQADPKPELSCYQVNAKPHSTIEERINRFLQLSKLLERREKVTEALEDLNDFQISPTGGANLKLTDSKGRTFAIAHPVVIGEMVAVANQKLHDELNIIDAAFLI